MNPKSLEQLKAFLNTVDKGVSRDEFLQAFKIFSGVVKEIKTIVEKMVSETEDKSSSMMEECMKSMEEMEKNVNEVSLHIESKTEIEIERAVKTFKAGLERLEGMIPDMVDLTPLEVKIQAIEAKIPEIPKELEAEQIRDKLESIKAEDDKLKIEAIGYLREELDKIKKSILSIGTGRSFFGGGALRIEFVDDETPTGTIDGVNDTFTLSTIPVPGTLKLYRGGARQRVTEDYTISGNTITFIIPPEVGEVLLADFRSL